MEILTPRFTRRHFLKGLGIGALSLYGVKAFSEEALRYFEAGGFGEDLIRTPEVTEGPFYPDKMPLDLDNDLIVVKPSTTPAVGRVTHLTGRVLDLSGQPIRGATVEIWQVDNNGAYIHSQSGNRTKLDKNFQGFGRFETDSTGAYRFRTIKPVPYPGRAPHIHVKVKKGDRELLTTQVLVKGDKLNVDDGVLMGVRDAKQRASIIVPFEPKADSRLGELLAKFDIVIGYTPQDEHP